MSAASEGRRSTSLVTGVAGFIGSHLAEALLRVGRRVVGVDVFLDNYPRSNKEANLSALREHGEFTFRETTAGDPDLVPLLRDVDRIYHLAALPGVRPSWGESFGRYLENNVEETQKLLEASLEAGVSRFVYASSSSVYGDTDALPMGEDDRERPYSPYGVSKLAGEHLVRLYHRNHGLHTTSVRYFTVYGPRQRPDMAIQKFLSAAAAGEAIPVYGDGEQTRDFTYVSDAVEATVRAADRGEAGAVYNVGGGSNVTVNELTRVVERVTGSALEVVREPEKPGDVRHTRADCGRARSVLGFVPRTSLEAGIGHQWEWHLGGCPTDA